MTNDLLPQQEYLVKIAVLPWTASALVNYAMQ